MRALLAHFKVIKVFITQLNTSNKRIFHMAYFLQKQFCNDICV